MLKYFRFKVQVPGNKADDPYEEYVIFARYKYIAEYIFGSAAWNRMESFGWTGEEWERFGLNDTAPEFQELLKGDTEGVGIYDIPGGWRIVTISEIEEQDADP